MFDVTALANFASQQTVALGDGDTVFEIEKMPARQAHRVWLEALQMLGASDKLAEALGAVDLAGENDAASVVRVIQGVLSLDVDQRLRLQAQVFGHVWFTNSMARTRQRVAVAEDTAYVGLEPFDIDELFVRAFAVNFTPSLQRVVSKLHLLAPQTEDSPSR